MNTSYSRFPVALAAALVALTFGAACGKKQPEAPAPAPTAAVPQAPSPVMVAVSGIQLGNAVAADKRVVAPMTVFRPTDTIYAAVATTGSSAKSTISAKWTYQDGQVVHEESVSIAPNGANVTDFQISKSDGWPVGDYRVEVMLDAQPAGGASFRVGV